MPARTVNVDGISPRIGWHATLEGVAAAPRIGWHGRHSRNNIGSVCIVHYTTGSNKRELLVEVINSVEVLERSLIPLTIIAKGDTLRY